MTWGSSHAQLPRAAGPRWCQRGWPPRRGSWVLPKKKREARKGPATATDASYIDTPHIRCSFFHSRRWQSSVQGESRPYKGRARKTSNHSDLNELISGSGVRICLDLVYVVPLLGFFFFFFVTRTEWNQSLWCCVRCCHMTFPANFKWGEKWWRCSHLLNDPNLMFIFKSGLLAHVVIHSVSLSLD